MQQPEAIENPSIADIKSVIIEHAKTSHKLSKTIRQTGKVSQAGSGKRCNSPLYNKTKKGKFFERKNCKINKTSTCL